jgi:hypothetical protein
MRGIESLPVFLLLTEGSNHQKMYTSNRIPHTSGLYHEQIFRDNQFVAQVLSEDDGSFWFVLAHNHSISRGYKTVAEAKNSCSFLLIVSLIDSLN